MTSARYVVDFVHYPLHLVSLDAQHEWSGESSFVDFSVHHDAPDVLGYDLSGRPFLGCKFFVGDVCVNGFAPWFVETEFGWHQIFL